MLRATTVMVLAPRRLTPSAETALQGEYRRLQQLGYAVRCMSHWFDRLAFIDSLAMRSELDGLLKSSATVRMPGWDLDPDAALLQALAERLALRSFEPGELVEPAGG